MLGVLHGKDFKFFCRPHPSRDVGGYLTPSMALVDIKQRINWINERPNPVRMDIKDADVDINDVHMD